MDLVKLMAASLLSAALFCPGWASAQVAVASDDLHQPATSPNNVSATTPNPKTDQPAPKADEAAAKPEDKEEE